MQEDFLRWYATMSFGEDEGHAAKRFETVRALVKDPTTATLEVLIRLAFRLKIQTSAPEVAEVRSKLTGELRPPGDEELAMLAASALACAMDSDSDNSSLAATMVATASCGGLRSLAQPIDLVGMSKSVTRKLAEVSRRRPSLEPTRALVTSLDKTEVAAAETQVSEGNLGGALQTVVNSINKALAAVSRRQTAVETQFQKYTKLQDEELDILWWLQSGHCADLQNDFPDVPAEHRPLAIARELATLTKVLPGPTALQSLFLRAGVPEAPQRSIEVAVQGMPKSWLDMVLCDVDKDKISPVTTPILFALNRRKELDGDEGWAPPWSKLTSLDQGVELEPLCLAEMAYREFLLVQFG
ncbi:GTPase-associated system all-helical protein GASH [Rhodoferax ferrireducens]|uniref:GTPase-associated system all-helical protein GASH n=1 Tax=Rhodoferax ferrireducens TaxID=192843 RepID=UPI000E0DC06C|nr:GTPase-associated system all-helical protein GASH [Rhodoferax ferrireducens]